jgi:hypothetical protein
MRILPFIVSGAVTNGNPAEEHFVEKSTPSITGLNLNITLDYWFSIINLF